MQKNLVFAFAAFALAASAQGAYRGPWLKKFSGSGFVPEGHRVFSRCEIHAGKVVLTVGAEGLKSTREQAVALEGALAAMIDSAAKGPLVEDVAPVDAPAVIYQAVKLLPNDGVENVDLGSDTGAGKRTRNTSVAAQALRNFLDLNCSGPRRNH